MARRRWRNNRAENSHQPTRRRPLIPFRLDQHIEDLALGVGVLASRMTLPSRSTTQTCVSSIETSNPAKYSIAALLFISESRSYRLSGSSRPLPDVEKVRNRIAAKIRSNDILSKNRCSMPPQRGYGGRLLLQRQLPHPPKSFFDCHAQGPANFGLSPETEFFQQYRWKAVTRSSRLNDASAGRRHRALPWPSKCADHLLSIRRVDNRQ